MTSPICPLPWIHYSLENNGKASLCCISNDDSEYNDKRNSSAHKEIRRDLLKGQWPKACNRCQVEESSGGHSYRMGQLKHFPNFTQATARTYGEGPAPLESIDIRLGNQCNLACVMCRPSDSTTWISELKDHPLPEEMKSKVRMTIPPQPLRDSIIQKIPQDLENLTEVTLGGGEPLLLKDHDLLISHLIEANLAKNINLNYHTNLTKLDDQIFETWNKFKMVTLFVSLDGVEKWAEYVRYPTKWKGLHENINLVLKRKEEGANIQLRFLMTIHALNAPHLPDFIEYLIKLTKSSSEKFHKSFIPNLVMDPSFLHVANMPDAWKEKLSTEVSRLIPTYPRLKSLKTALGETGQKTDKKTLKTYVSYLEEARIVKLRDFAPNYYNDLIKQSNEMD